jgi:hypothetical protein
VTVGRPTLFQIVMEWETPWLPASEKRGEQRGGGLPAVFMAGITRRFYGGHHAPFLWRASRADYRRASRAVFMAGITRP